MYKQCLFSDTFYKQCKVVNLYLAEIFVLTFYKSCYGTINYLNLMFFFPFRPRNKL